MSSMRLSGYLKEFKGYMFTVPIYTDGFDYFFHIVDDDYKIVKFSAIRNDEMESLMIRKLDSDLIFKKGSFGAVVFVGEDITRYDVIYDELESGIETIESYLANNTKEDDCLYVKEDVSYFKEKINKKK